ncbi:hypothetical protein [Pseudomonas sp. NBRC 111132]|uniref:hypothetical protein n=1 Tax=Pseudomonas sp. NBRC 111132 TaxID=1661047 RepID=UPI000760E768|nr:hypothetical protein [Pseudomonas sp. NBRC 111132]
MEVPPLSDDESLVRAFFCPEHHDGQAFLATAVSLDDLKDRGFSVDRPTLTPLSVLTHRVDNQRAKNPEQREFPKYSQLFYSKLKEDRNAEGQHYFEVQPSPVLESGDMPGNPGHASIYSADKKLGNGGLRKVRTALIEHLNNVVELEHIPYIRDEAPE